METLQPTLFIILGCHYLISYSSFYITFKKKVTYALFTYYAFVIASVTWI